MLVADLSDALCLSMAQALERWPKLPRIKTVFMEHATRLNVAAMNLERHGEQLYLAVACIHRHPSAIQILERDFLKRSDRAMMHVCDSVGFVDDVRQEFRERLLVASPPTMAKYAATGPLGAWLRVAALRTALNAKKVDARWYSRAFDRTGKSFAREAREHDTRQVVQNALDAAIASLCDQDRRLLKLYYMEKESIQTIAMKHSAHRATISRWLRRTTRQISTTVIDHVAQTLGLSVNEAQGEVAHAHLGLEITEL